VPAAPAVTVVLWLAVAPSARSSPSPARIASRGSNRYRRVRRHSRGLPRDSLLFPGSSAF
jgi:hypothetical protein